MKKRVVIAFGIAVLVLALFVLAIGWEEVLGAIARAALPLYAGAFLASGLTLLARSYVWHRVLGVVDQRRPYWLVGGLFLTAMFAKYVTPYGQVTSGVGMAAVVSRYYESAYEESLAAIVSADFLNYVPYYTFGGIGLAYLLLSDSAPGIVMDYLPLALGSLAMLLVIIAAVWFWRNVVVNSVVRVLVGLRSLIAGVAPAIATRLTRDNVTSRFRGFSVTLHLLSQDRRTMATAAVSAHIAWLGLAGALYLSALAVGISLPFGIVFLSVALSKLGFIMPTPGGVGGVEIALAAVLYLLSPMSGAVATAVAILYRFATYWFTILIGGISSIALTMSDPTPP